MKIKHIISLLLVIFILPVGLIAKDSKTLENECDDLMYDAYYEAYQKGAIKAYTYMLGKTKYDKAAYKERIFNICRKDDCAVASYGSIIVHNEQTPWLNMPSFALFLNNKEIFEALLKEFPDLKYMVDNALSKRNSYNGEFLTPALSAIREGQYGVLTYLINNYDVNLLKKGGQIHAIFGHKDIIESKTFAEEAIEKWKAAIEEDDTPYNRKRLECAIKTQEVVMEWYKQHKNDSRYVREAEVYNKKIKAVAEDNIQVQIMPLFTPSLYQLQYIGGEDFAINSIEKQINGLIEQIMQNLEREFNSSELNQA